jgi:hypothetical protein
MNISSFIEKATLRQLFLIDGIGALVSTVSLGVLLVQFNVYIGMPIPVLYLLAGIAALFALYSWSCFFFLKQNKPAYLRAIALANLSYACLTTGLMVYYASLLTPLGFGYFIIEILILFGLVYIELSVAALSPSGS